MVALSVPTPMERQAKADAIAKYSDELKSIGNDLADRVKRMVYEHNESGNHKYAVGVSQKGHETEIVVYEHTGQPIKKMFGRVNTGKTTHAGIYHAQVTLMRGMKPEHVLLKDGYKPHIENYSKKYSTSITCSKGCVVDFQSITGWPLPYPTWSCDVDIDGQISFLKEKLGKKPALYKGNVRLARTSSLVNV